mgnify:CR=1 FL=1
MKKPYILAFDAGTTSSRAIIFDHDSRIIGTAQQEFPQIYPQPGWVEHDPMEIWATQSGVARQVLEKCSISPTQIAAIGITNQRETTILWQKSNGKPISNAIVWQDKRTAALCTELKKRGLEQEVRQRTGLVIDSYFSATKIAWMLQQNPEFRKQAENGEILFGTVDSWLVYNLTRGKVHATDYSNASRTMLFNINTLDWDDFLLKELNIPRAMLPEVKASSTLYGTTDSKTFGGAEIPIAGIAGDQQAALFGQACWEKGMAKNTYGTGSFILMNTGTQPIHSQNGLITTIAWGLNSRVEYALEGSVFITGAAVQWLRDEMKVLNDASDSEYFAGKVTDSGGVYVVPAFAGLGAPYWDMYARGTIVGITRGTGMNHIIRATLESLAYQVRDVADCMTADSGIALQELKADGGAAANNFIMQFQADILNTPVIRPKLLETTALGAAMLAGLATGFWQDTKDIGNHQEIDRIFKPEITDENRNSLYTGWRRAVERSQGWIQE